MTKILNSLFGLLGYVPSTRERMLTREIILLEQEKDTLIKEIEELRDENLSLWDLLDEIKKSDMSQHQNALKALVDDLKEVVTEEMLKDFKPIGEA